MRKILSLFFIILFSLSVDAQKEDYVWLTGYSSNTVDSTFGGTRIDFNTEPPTVSYEFREMDFFLASASICDTAGNLLFYTDATTVMNGNNEIIENGEELGVHPYHRSRALMGLGVPQVSLIFKYPGSDSTYIIIHEELSDEEIGDAGTSIPNCYYSILSESSSFDSFSVIEKNINIISDTLTYGKMTATRHANGRDWWILVGEYETNNYYTILLTKNGIEEIFQQSLGDTPVIGLAGQSVFSPDGSKYAHKGAFYFTEPGSVDIYDFDRCSGLLSNSLHIPVDTTEEGFIDGGLGGLAFSPDSELLYHSRDRRIEQYDLRATDIVGSMDTIAFYDGFQDPITGVPTNYGLAQLGPNGKIYVATTGNTRFMHIIHNPNERGSACDVEQHGLQLATFNDWSVPNHPNYRLKALIGSPCDTIRPIAAFTYDSLTNTIFTDQSERIPTEWYWTFGDGSSSNIQNPEHTYTESGTYEICLIATNEAGSDTICQELMVVITNVDELQKAGFTVFPNPTRGELTVVLPNTQLRNWRLVNVLGQVMKVGTFSEATESLDWSDLGDGMYWLEVNGLGVRKIIFVE